MTSVLAAGDCSDTLIPAEEQMTHEPENDGVFSLVLAALQEVPPGPGGLSPRDVCDPPPEPSDSTAVREVAALSLPVDGRGRSLPGTPSVPTSPPSRWGAEVGLRATSAPDDPQGLCQPSGPAPLPRTAGTQVRLAVTHGRVPAVPSRADVVTSAPPLPPADAGALPASPRAVPSAPAAAELVPLSASPSPNMPALQLPDDTWEPVTRSPLVPQVTAAVSAHGSQQPELLDSLGNRSDRPLSVPPSVQPARGTPLPRTALSTEQAGTPSRSPVGLQPVDFSAPIPSTPSASVRGPVTLIPPTPAPRLQLTTIAPPTTPIAAGLTSAVTPVAVRGLSEQSSPWEDRGTTDTSPQPPSARSEALHRPMAAVPLVMADPTTSVGPGRATASALRHWLAGDGGVWVEPQRQTPDGDARHAAQRTRATPRVMPRNDTDRPLEGLLVPVSTVQRRDRGTFPSVATASVPSRPAPDMEGTQPVAVASAPILPREPEVPALSELQVEVQQPGAGEVTVRVREDDSRTVAAAVVLDGPVPQHLTQHLEASVRQAMAQEGLALSSFELSEHSDGRPAPAPLPHHAGGRPTDRQRASRPVAAPAPAPGPTPTTDRVDIYA